MPEFDIYLRFDAPEDRDAVLGHLRTLVPDGELIEQGDTVFRRLHADEENAAHIPRRCGCARHAGVRTSTTTACI